MTVRPGDYRDLINAYLAKQISIDYFRECFNEAYRAEPVGMDQTLFLILDTMRGALEVYSPRASLGHETPFLISEETLRTEAAAVLARLNAHVADG